jgi:adenosine kinase
LPPLDLACLLACSDIIFGNESEAEAFAKANDYGTTDVKEIALKLAAHAKV